MKVVIAGGSGFLGSPLAEAYAEEGHDVRVLTRSLTPGESRHDPGTGVPGITRVGWTADGQRPMGRRARGRGRHRSICPGSRIDRGRWTPQRKARLRDSRILATRSLAAAILAAAAPPAVFVSGSARRLLRRRRQPAGDRVLTAGPDFLAQLCDDWEAEARRAEAAGIRVAVLRTGVVLERSGGALPRMMLPYRFFVGGPLGSGRQYVSWIHRLDWMEIVRWIVQTADASGPVNATAPHPVTSRELSTAIGHALHRPSLVPVPAFALRIAVGELADSLLTGQRVIPERALALGYHFRYPDIDQAMRGIFGV